jgi:hypothetical protein
MVAFDWAALGVLAAVVVGMFRAYLIVNCAMDRFEARLEYWRARFAADERHDG